MRKITIRMAMLFAFIAFLSAGAFKADVNAADWTSKVAHIGYISSDNKLVLRFRAVGTFSTNGFTYEVDGTGLKGDIASGVDTVKVDISSIIEEGKTYTLTVTSKSKGHYMKVNYYAGTAKVKGLSAAQNDDKMKASWSVDGDNDYSALYLYTAKNGEFLKKSGSDQNMQLQKLSKSADSFNKKITGLRTGTNTAYVVGMKGSNYFGYGAAVSFSFIGQPGKVSLVANSGKNAAHLHWSTDANATHYIVYIKKPGSSSYLRLKTLKSTSYIAEGLKKGGTYSFIVKPIATNGKITKNGTASSAATCKIVSTPGKATGLKLYIRDSKGTILGLKWNAAKGAKSYIVYAKQSGTSEWVYLGETSKTNCSLSKLDYSKKYSVKIYSKKGSVCGPASKSVTVKPGEYLQKNKNKMLARKVKTIKYLANKKCVTTKKRYTQEVKEAYVNYHGYSSSSKYLIWANLYTQQTTIYTGKKGHWKMFATFDVASGSWENRTPRGTHKISYKEPKWQHSGWHSSYVSHFYKKASFHMRPKYNNGKLKDARLRKPISNACIRCPDKWAIFIYKNIPRGTTVRVW